MTTKLQLDAQDRTARVLCAYLRGDRDTANKTFREALAEPGQDATLGPLINRIVGQGALAFAVLLAAGLAVDVAGGDEAQALRNLEAARAEVAYTTPEEHDPDTPTG